MFIVDTTILYHNLKNFVVSDPSPHQLSYDIFVVTKNITDWIEREQQLIRKGTKMYEG